MTNYVSLELNVNNLARVNFKWERLVLPLEINEGVSREQDSQNTIFNIYEIRIVCKI